MFDINKIFPDAQAIFSHKLLSVETIKNDCIIVLDTNVLLLPYDTGKSSLDQISKIYKKLIEEKRLVVPGQVVREFAKNRGRKVSELFQQISRKRNNLSIRNDTYPLLESLKEYQETVKFEEEIIEVLNKYRKSIGKLIDKISDWQWNDPVSELYRELFSKDVVFDPILNYEEISKDLLRRNEQKIPPGYKDAEKNDSGVGDLIIWNTILKVAEEKNKNLIFVSGDEKADWQIRSENQPLYPRYELVDEYRQKSSGASFHILSFSKFLDLYGVSENVLAEIRNKELLQGETAKWDSESNFSSFAEDAVKDWLTWNYREQKVARTQSGSADLEIIYNNDNKIGVVIKSPSKFSTSWLKILINTMTHLAKQEGYQNIILAIVLQNDEQLEETLRIVKAIDYLNNQVVALLIGTLSGYNKSFRSAYFK